MKKTRIGGSILLLIVLMALFVALAVGLSKLFETEEKSSGLIDALDYGSRIGIIPIEGTIMTSDEILKDLRKFQKKSSRSFGADLT